MRKSLLLVCAVLSLLVVAAFVGGQRAADALVLYVRVARLYSQDPPKRITMPFVDVSKRNITDTWHAPRGTNRLHEGQDIFAPRGTPIYSATKGYIYNIGENPLGGRTVSVAGAGGRFYYYAHLESYATQIKEGDYVTPQTVLGYVGTSGNAQGTPPHLHFGIYSPTGALNPLPLLSDRAKAAKQNEKAGANRRKSKAVDRKRTRARRS